MPGGRGRLPLDSKVIGMLVVFRVQNSDFGIFLGSQLEVCAEMKFWYFLGSAHFPYRVKMKSFRKVFNELGKSCLSNCEQLVQKSDFLPMFYQACLFGGR